MSSSKAFTLIELLVVVAIVGVLASIGIYSFSNFTSTAKDAAIKAQHKGIHDFIDLTLTTKCITSASRFTLKATSILTNNLPVETPFYCNYTNLWQTVCEVSQSFRIYYRRVYLKNPIDGSEAIYFFNPGSYTINCEAQGSMSTSEWINKGSPHSIIIISKLSDNTEYKTYIPKKWR